MVYLSKLSLLVILLQTYKLYLTPQNIFKLNFES